MKTKIKLITLGNLPFEFNLNTIKNWKSDLFEIIDPIEKHSITKNSDGSDWEFSDSNIESLLPERFEADLLLAITNVPLQDNYYSRRLSNKRVCITFNEMSDYLKNEKYSN